MIKVTVYNSINGMELSRNYEERFFDSDAELLGQNLHEMYAAVEEEELDYPDKFISANEQETTDPDRKVTFTDPDQAYDEARDEQIENEIDELLLEKQGDLEDLSRDNFLNK